MDYLYAELPEIVYDPSDLTAKCLDGTINASVDNNKRVINLAVVKTPATLTVIDQNNHDKVYEFNGSQPVEVTIPKFDTGIVIEYKVCEVAGTPIAGLLAGDGYLEITDGAGKVSYAPLVNGGKTGDIQKVQTVKKIYTLEDFGTMPKDGNTYLVKVIASNPYLTLYRYGETDNAPQIIGNVTKDTIYAVIDSGLLAMLDTSDSYNPVLKELTASLDNKQNTLVFDDVYDSENNRVVTESTTEAIKAIMSAKFGEYDDKL